MSRLPLIVGFGGINPAGRSSSHHAYQRLVLDCLPLNKQHQTLQSLAQLMSLGVSDLQDQKVRQVILDGTLIRKIDKELFDSEHVYCHQLVKTAPDTNGTTLSFRVHKERLPNPLPATWKIHSLNDTQVQVNIVDAHEFLLPQVRQSTVQVAGQLPRGLDFTRMYPSRNHPRGLQMSLFAINDALGHLGMDWDGLKSIVELDQISVYAGSAMGQMDMNANGGLLMAHLLGKRPTSKQLAFGMADMPVNFINAYVLGNLGATGNVQGACAGFLYNLRQGINDIRDGRARIAIVGASEAVITPEMLEGFAAMGALSSDEDLKELGQGNIDYVRACRPFGDNRGFVVGESAQYFVLMDDELALQTGASIYGAIADTFINADGFKKSIASPGAGNYVTLAKAVAMAKSILGAESVRSSYILAHGTGTPQNRVTESKILSLVAGHFKLGVNHLKGCPVIAPKSYLGHSIAASSADQLLVALGVWAQGWLPGIWSIDNIAADVTQENLDFVLKTRHIDTQQANVCFINSKGFGGNNASAAILAPHIVEQMLSKKHGLKKMHRYKRYNAQVVECSALYEQRCLRGEANMSYFYDYNVLDDAHISSNVDTLSVAGMQINLQLDNPYADMQLFKS